MKLPFPATWWIEPGKIIGGRYPGTKAPDECRKMLAKYHSGHLDTGLLADVCPGIVAKLVGVSAVRGLPVE